VFLVRGGPPWQRLLRMKQWRTQVTLGFLEAFDELKLKLEAWREPAIVMPVTAWVDAAGLPSVLTEFRQGVPLLQLVSSGRLNTQAADAALQQLRDVIGAAHARSLAHGSIVAGNVFVGAAAPTAYLLDFGLAALLMRGATFDSLVESDLEGFARLQATLRASSPNSEGL
jgi:serine/threonine protein kinase